MPIQIDLRQLDEPLLEFGSPSEFSDIRQGLREAGPFDLRFWRRAQRDHYGRLGVRQNHRSYTEMAQPMPKLNSRSSSTDMTRYPAFPGFTEVFHAKLVQDSRFVRSLGGDSVG